MEFRNSSPRNRNNSRIDLSSLFEVLANNESYLIILSKNQYFKAKERNKTYTPDAVKIYAHLETNDPFLLFVKFICYNFLPVEVCRLKVAI
jgi:hypothetical protein